MTRAADLTSEQRAALLRHGYPADLNPRGASGPPDEVYTPPPNRPDWQALRNHVCWLDGIEIDGHEETDLDPGSGWCVPCGKEAPRWQWEKQFE